MNDLIWMNDIRMIKQSGHKIWSNVSYITSSGKFHEGPDSENNTDEKHSNEEDQGIKKSRSHVTKRGMGVPGSKHFVPRIIGHTFVSNSFSEMSMWLSIVSVDEISSFPDHNNTDEKTNQANSVENGHKCLTLISISN